MLDLDIAKLPRAQIGAPSPDAPPAGDGPAVIYDGGCRVSTASLRRLNFRAAAGPVRLIDAAGSDDRLVATATALGLDPRRGVIVALGGRFHQGAGAMMALAALTRREGLVGRAAGSAFATPGRAALAYPLFRALCRLAPRGGRAAPVRTPPDAPRAPRGQGPH